MKQFYNRDSDSSDRLGEGEVIAQLNEKIHISRKKEWKDSDYDTSSKELVN